MKPQTTTASEITSALMFFLFSAIIFFAVLPPNLFHQPTSTFNFFDWLSHGTVLSNLLSSIVFFLTGQRLLSHREASIRFGYVRGAATVYLTLALLLYPFLLMSRPYFHDGNFEWRDFILHFANPLLMLGWWMLYPPRMPVSIAAAATWLIPPLIYLGCIYLRGNYVNWYPYGFLSPAEHSVGGLFKIIFSLGLFVFLLAQLIAWMSRVKVRQLSQ